MVVCKSRSIPSALGLGLLVVVTAACGVTTRYFTPPPSTTTLMAGWERRFTVEWTVTPEHNGFRRVEGHVSNLDGERAQSLRLLARAVDSQGQVQGQQITWVQGGLGGFGRANFVIPRLPEANSYVVTVWDYSLFQSPSYSP
jgi:hypothetical protein